MLNPCQMLLLSEVWTFLIKKDPPSSFWYKPCYYHEAAAHVGALPTFITFIPLLFQTENRFVAYKVLWVSGEFPP